MVKACFNFSEKECADLQLHEDQTKFCKSEERAIKSKSARSKYRRSPYQISKTSQPTIQQLYHHHTNHTTTSPAEKWINSKTSHSSINWSSYLSQQQSPITTARNQSPESSSNSCYDDGLVDQHSLDNSPTTRDDHSSYWKPHSNCIFGAFDTTAVPEDLYKVAYGSYYQRLAATAARTYGQMANHNRFSDFYYPSTYTCSKFT